jgi:hypothetical protein
MFQVILKGLKRSFFFFFVFFKYPILVSKISMSTFCKFLDQIDQKLKPIGIYSFKFNSQNLFFSVDKLLIDKFHLSPAQTSYFCQIVDVTVGTNGL